MPDFRHPPQWQQQADRHSRLTDPVITVRQLSRVESRKPPSRIDYAHVFVTAQGTYDTYLPPHRPSRATAAGKRYSVLYEVDIGVHPVQVRLPLPSDNESFEFDTTADLTWQVSDPARFVHSGERDVPALLGRELLRLLRPVSRLHPITDGAAAERAVQSAYDSAQPFEEQGLRVSCGLRLRRDEIERAHQERLRATRHDTEAATPEHELEVLRLEHERIRQQHEQRILAQKIEFYQYHLQNGGVDALILHLAQHPEDTRLAVESLRADQADLVRTQLHVIDRVVGEGLEQYQLDEPRQLAVQRMQDLLNQNPQTPQPPRPGQPPPGLPGQPPAVPPPPPAPPGAARGGQAGS